MAASARSGGRSTAGERHPHPQHHIVPSTLRALPLGLIRYFVIFVIDIGTRRVDMGM
jgi:hypothetical protein